MDAAISQVFLAGLGTIKNELASHLEKTLKVEKKKIIQSLDSFSLEKPSSTDPLMLVEDYSEKGIALIGDTRSCDLLLSSAKLFTKNEKLAFGSGWVSSKDKLPLVKNFLRTNKIVFITKSRETLEQKDVEEVKKESNGNGDVVWEDSDDGWDT